VDLSLSPEESQLVATLHALLASRSSPAHVRASEDTGFDRELWSELVDLGVPSMAVDGGGGEAAGLFQLALVAEQCGAALASAPVLESLVAARLLARCGGGGGELLDAACRGETIVTVFLEPVRAGVPSLVPAGAIADVVLGLDGDDIVAVTSDPPTVRADNLGSLPLAFRDVGVGTRTVVAGRSTARSLFDSALADWKVLSAAQLTGLASAALELGVEYVKSREVFGAPIATFQTIAHRLADDATAVDGARLLAYEAGWAADEGRERAGSLASMAWLFASETAVATARDALHYHGGYGFTTEYDIQLYFRRAKAYSLLWGDPGNEYRCLSSLLFGPAQRSALAGGPR
jgi:alkylation response protein AidB-like acyl-CoA dehydrogenase